MFTTNVVVTGYLYVLFNSCAIFKQSNQIYKNKNILYQLLKKNKKKININFNELCNDNLYFTNNDHKKKLNWSKNHQLNNCDHKMANAKN